MIRRTSKRQKCLFFVFPACYCCPCLLLCCMNGSTISSGSDIDRRRLLRNTPCYRLLRCRYFIFQRLGSPRSLRWTRLPGWRWCNILLLWGFLWCIYSISFAEIERSRRHRCLFLGGLFGILEFLHPTLKPTRIGLQSLKRDLK